MKFLEAMMDKTKLNDKAKLDHLLAEQIGARLPKKLRKKRRWKKVAPILSVIITLIIQLLDTLGGHSRSRRTTPPSSTATGAGGPKPVSGEQYGNSVLRAYVDRAIAYQAEINRLAQNSANPGDQNRVGELATHVQDWTEAIITLARRIDAFQQNKLIN